MKRRLVSAALLVVLSTMSPLTTSAQVSTTAPITLVMTAGAVPGLKASNPNPPDGATGVTAPLLEWTAGATARRHDVYFGTNPTPGPAEYIGRQPMPSYSHAPGLIPGTTYYWRIDEVGHDLTTIHTGDVWSFTAAGAVPGLKASDPNPPDGATGVTDPLLEWTAGETAKSHDVYLGTNPTPGAPEHKGRLPHAMYWHLPGFTAGATYYWRVNEVEEDGTTIHTGDVWSFTALPSTASSPDPPDGAENVPTDTDLSWVAGITSITHDVYFGTDQTHVANGTGGTFKGNQPHVVYDPGTLQMGTTYYWRIDEIEQDGTTIHTGDVWSFTTELFAYRIDGNSITATASSSNHEGEGPENTINGSGLDDDLHSTVQQDMWLSAGAGPQPTWIQYEFDKVYKLHQMLVWNHNTAFETWLGFGFKDVTVEYSTDGTNWIELGGVPQFAQGTGSADYAANTTVDFSGAVARYVKITVNSNWGTFIQYGLSEVHFLYIPVRARYPSPQDEATGVGPDVVLSWTAGFDAITHDVYFGTDQTHVANGTGGTFKGNQPDVFYDPGTLQMGSTYYWRIDEIDADTITKYPGDVWSFTVAAAAPGLKASDPNPPDGATGVTKALLEWTAGTTANWHGVYFGTNPTPGPAEYVGRQLVGLCLHDPGALQMGTTYYWRIDEIERDRTTIHTGDVWSFKTAMPDLVALEIMGPDEVVEDSSAQYRAVARYEDGSTKDVTAAANWSLDPPDPRLLPFYPPPPGYAIDENGLLTIGHVDKGHITVTIFAEYTEGDVTVNAEKTVWCIPSEVKIYHVDALNGDDNNDGLSPETAFATIQMAIDSAEDVSQPAQPPPRRDPAPVEPNTIKILVYPGVYAEAINFKGKAITLASAQDAAVLEAPDDYAVSFYSGEGSASVLKNFVIRNSYLGIFIVDSSPTISNVTVVGNKFGIAAYADANPDISNSIFWNNTDGDLSGCQARYSCTEQISQGEGNISIADPLFADPANGDYHLLSRRGRYVPAHGLWSFDDVTSPCIDAGDPAVDPSNERMPHSGRINMGAYGGTAYASLSEWPIASDLNRDGVVDLADLSIVCRQWLMELPSGGVVPEDDPPVPDPAQWDLDGQPQEVYGGGGVFDYLVEMRAVEAADASGWVEYLFECTTDLRFSSGWQRSLEYRVLIGRQGQGLRFRVKARDLYGNETAWSEELPAEGPT